MSNLLSAFNSAATSMSSYEKAIEVVQNDTVNANTPGYVRQTVSFEALPFSLQGALAGGVRTSQLTSSRDEYSEHNVQVQQTALSLSSTIASHLSAIEPTFDLQSTTGIAGSINTLFSSFSQLTVSPNDAQARQSVIGAASGLANAFNIASQNVEAAKTSVDQDTRSTITDINKIVADVQRLNIERRRDSQSGSDPGLDAQLHNDLETLSQFTGFTTIQGQDGTVNLYLGGQKPLLIGATQYSLSAQTGSGATTILDSSGNDITSYVSGGQLAGLLQIKNNLLPGYSSQLDQLASGVADTVNAQLAAGVDKSGNVGQPLFSYNTAAAAKTLSVTSITANGIAAASASNAGGSDNAIALSKAQNTTIAALGGFTATQFYGTLSATVGRDISNAQNDETTQQQLLAQAKSIRSDQSSVSLDEEAARLVEYQKAYDATSKLISVINDMTQTLLGLIPTGS
jgi:flagellar hook-associated protein 1